MAARLFGVALLLAGLGLFLLLKKLNLPKQWRKGNAMKKVWVAVATLVLVFVVAQLLFIGEYAILRG